MLASNKAVKKGGKHSIDEKGVKRRCKAREESGRVSARKGSP